MIGCITLHENPGSEMVTVDPAGSTTLGCKTMTNVLALPGYATVPAVSPYEIEDTLNCFRTLLTWVVKLKLVAGIPALGTDTHREGSDWYSANGRV